MSETWRDSDRWKSCGLGDQNLLPCLLVALGLYMLAGMRRSAECTSFRSGLINQPLSLSLSRSLSLYLSAGRLSQALIRLCSTACPSRTLDFLEACALVASSSSSSVARADFDSLMMLLIFARRLVSWHAVGDRSSLLVSDKELSLRKCDAQLRACCIARTASSVFSSWASS